jgi:hypothetical protein
LRPTRAPAGSSASAIATPTASDRPDQSAGLIGNESENVSEAPMLACQVRPRRPRPPVWCSATSRQGCTSAARRPKAPLSMLRRTCTSSSVGGSARTRARSSRALLVETLRATTSTLRPGNSGSSRCHSASAPHCKV